MAGTARLVRVRFGVSPTDDGQKVLTPFGRFGRCYVYSEPLFRNFLNAMNVICWSTTLFAVAAIAGYLLGHVSRDAMFVLFTLDFVIGDAIRVLIVLWLFRRAQRVQGISTLEEWQKRFLIFGGLALQNMVTFVLIFFEFIVVANIAVSLAQSRPIDLQDIAAALILHAIVYFSRYLVARNHY